MKQKTIVLTFDDAVSNHATFVAPLLQKYNFNATFYVCEFPPDFETNKQQYMTWEQIKSLDTAGFEIGNHTRRHTGVIGLSPEALIAEMKSLDDICARYGIRKTETFAYPGGPCDQQAMDVVARYGFKWARAVGARPFRLNQDNPMLVPGFPVHGDNTNVFYDAIAQADDDAIPVLMFHGVPEYTHPWVNTAPEIFASYMEYLAENNFKVLAMRDLPGGANR